VNPARDQDEHQAVRRFDLVRDDSTETRRSDRERWTYDPNGPRTREIVGTFSRDGLVELIGIAADVLAWLPQDGAGG
jgi:hypothetical protein